MITVRFTLPSDYAEITKLHNDNNEPHFHSTSEKLAASDANNPDYPRLVAVENEKIVGTASTWYWQEVDSFRFSIDALHKTASLALLEQIEQQTKHKCLLSTIRADFLETAWHLQTGFQEVFRSFGAELELAHFDPTAFLHLEPKLLKQGIQIIKRTDWQVANAIIQLEEVQAEANADIPGYEPVVTMRMDFQNCRLQEPFWLAVKDSKCLGFICLDGQIHLDAGGVLRSQRNLGIGTALLAKAASWAKNQGFSDLNDGGAKANKAHIRMLEKIGFQLEPDWITFEKKLKYPINGE